MAIEIWARDRLDEGLDSGVLVFVDERGEGEFAQPLLVYGGDVSAGQLVSPESPPQPQSPPPSTPPPGAPPRPFRIPILPPETKPRRRRFFVILLGGLEPTVHAFDASTLFARALQAIEDGERYVSLHPANREEWGHIEALPAIGEARRQSEEAPAR